MKAIHYYTILIAIILPINCLAQGYIRTDYLMSSSLRNDEGSKFGSGDLLKISGLYSLPLYVKQNSSGQIKAWSATLNGSYGRFQNKDIVKTVIPDEVVNLSLSISHMRPISEKWYLIASLGGGIYAEPVTITKKSILVNGGVFFVYRIQKKLDVGMGLGVTTSYGAPMIMPMSYVKWELTGKYEIKAEAANSMQVSASAKFSERFKLRLVAMEMDGMSAVMNIDEKSMVYSSAIMKSYISPELKIGKSSTLFLGAGISLSRMSKVTERNLKYFWEMLKKDKENESLYFNPTGYFTIGFRYGF